MRRGAHARNSRVHSFENCWPAIMNKSHGAVLVYSPENDAHVGEVGAW